MPTFSRILFYYLIILFSFFPQLPKLYYALMNCGRIDLAYKIEDLYCGNGDVPPVRVTLTTDDEPDKSNIVSGATNANINNAVTYSSSLVSAPRVSFELNKTKRMDSYNRGSTNMESVVNTLLDTVKSSASRLLEGDETGLNGLSSDKHSSEVPVPAEQSDSDDLTVRVGSNNSHSVEINDTLLPAPEITTDAELNDITAADDLVTDAKPDAGLEPRSGSLERVKENSLTGVDSWFKTNNLVDNAIDFVDGMANSLTKIPAIGEQSSVGKLDSRRALTPDNEPEDGM